MRLEFRRGKTEKFWSAKLDGKQLFVQFGAIGNVGQTRLTKFASVGEAKTAMATAIAKKLGEGYVATGKPAAEKPALSTIKRTAMLAIARELGGKAVETEVAMAIDRPEAYLERFAETYETIEGVDHAAVPWLGLIEVLNEREVVAEIDWKEAGSEVLAWLERIGGAAAKRALKAAHEPTIDDRRTDEALAWMGGMLGKQKLALIQLDKASDSYALAIVEATRAKPLIKLARTAGERIVHHDGADLAKLTKERQRDEAKHSTANKNAWATMVAEHAHVQISSAVDSVLWGLLHNNPTIDRVRAAVTVAPKRDRPLIEMTIAIYDGSASKLAKTTKQPELLLQALRYLEARTVERRYERLAAAAILADRLKIAPDRGKRHHAVCAACNLWSYDKQTDAQLARLPAAARDRLARFGDGLLGKQTIEGTEDFAEAMRMLSICGDAKSLPLLAEVGKRSLKAREENEYDLSPPYAWEEAAKHISRRRSRR